MVSRRTLSWVLLFLVPCMPVTAAMTARVENGFDPNNLALTGYVRVLVSNSGSAAESATITAPEDRYKTTIEVPAFTTQTVELIAIEDGPVIVRAGADILTRAQVASINSEDRIIVVSERDTGFQAITQRLAKSANNNGVPPVSVTTVKPSRLPSRRQGYPIRSLLVIHPTGLQSLSVAQAQALYAHCATYGNCVFVSEGKTGQFTGTCVEPLLPVKEEGTESFSQWSTYFPTAEDRDLAITRFVPSVRVDPILPADTNLQLGAIQVTSSSLKAYLAFDYTAKGIAGTLPDSIWLKLLPSNLPGVGDPASFEVAWPAWRSKNALEIEPSTGKLVWTSIFAALAYGVALLSNRSARKYGKQARFWFFAPLTTVVVIILSWYYFRTNEGSIRAVETTIIRSLGATVQSRRGTLSFVGTGSATAALTSPTAWPYPLLYPPGGRHEVTMDPVDSFKLRVNHGQNMESHFRVSDVRSTTGTLSVRILNWSMIKNPNLEITNTTGYTLVDALVVADDLYYKIPSLPPGKMVIQGDDFSTMPRGVRASQLMRSRYGSSRFLRAPEIIGFGPNPTPDEALLTLVGSIATMPRTACIVGRAPDIGPLMATANNVPLDAQTWYIATGSAQ